MSIIYSRSVSKRKERTSQSGISDQGFLKTIGSTMRCPECSTRNSVAALKCAQCGSRFKRRPLPIGLLAGIAGAVVLFVSIMGAVALVPGMFNPESNLQKIAKQVARGPKNARDAERMKAELEDAVKRYLEKHTELGAEELGAKLRAIFPSSVYEISAFELPRNIKLIEIDTLLQSSNYLISKNHVFVLRGFEVFDAAKAFDDSTGPVLALVGHRNAQSGRHPQVRLLALLPDGFKARPEDSVPHFTGDGSAAFSANGKDIDLDLSLISRAVQEGLFDMQSLQTSGLKDENLKVKLTFVDGKYKLSDTNGTSALAALRAAAFVLSDGSAKGRFQEFFSPQAAGAIDRIGKLKTCPPEFEVKRLGSGAVTTTTKIISAGSSNQDSSDNRRRSRRHRRRHQSNNAPTVVTTTTKVSGFRYLLANSDDALEITLSQGKDRFQVADIKRSSMRLASAATSASIDPGQEVPYEDKTSNLVDKLLDSPDPVLPASERLSATAVMPNTSAGVTTNQPEVSKVVEKQIVGEAAFIDATSPTVKVRKGPSTGYQPISEAAKGTQLEVIGKQDGWYKVRVNGKEGFIYGAFVNCKTADAYTTGTLTRSKSIKDANNHTISRAQNGDRLVVLTGSTNERYKVQLSDGRIGYIDKEAISLAGAPPVSVSPAAVAAPAMQTESRPAPKPAQVVINSAVKPAPSAQVSPAANKPSNSSHSERRRSRRSRSRSSEPSKPDEMPQFVP